MTLSELLNNTTTGIGNIVNDYRGKIASSQGRVPEGSPNILQALGVLLKNRQKQKQIEDYGYYQLDNPIELLYGTASKSNDFDRIQGNRNMMEYLGLYASPEN